MKTLAPFTQDGFKASIELLRFQRDMHNDLIQAVTSIIGTSPTFIKGGEITQAGGNTTITNGIICYNEKLYTFTGGTFAGTPATLKVLFEEGTAAGYPQPYLVGDPVPKDIYIARTARIDVGGSANLDTIVKIENLKFISDKALLVDGKANKNGYSEIFNDPSITFNKGGVTNSILRQYDSGIINFSALFVTSSSISNSDWLIRGLPKSNQLYTIMHQPYIDSSVLTDPIAGYKSIGVYIDASDYTKSEVRLFTGNTLGANKIILMDFFYLST